MRGKCPKHLFVFIPANAARNTQTIRRSLGKDEAQYVLSEGVWMRGKCPKHLLAFIPALFLITAAKSTQTIIDSSDSSLTVKIRFRCYFFLSLLWNLMVCGSDFYCDSYYILLHFSFKRYPLSRSHSLCILVSFQRERSLNFHLIHSPIYSTNRWVPNISQIWYQ